MTTNAQFNQLFKRWVRRLCLTNWRFDITLDADLDGADARVRVHDQYDEAELYFAETWRAWSERKLEETIVHELLHVHMHQIEVAADHVRDNLSYDAKVMHDKVTHHAHEQVVERLSIALVSLAHED